MQKNVTGQKWVVFAFSRTSGSPITGDSSNITANIRIDGGSANPVDDLNPAELSNGYYYFDVSQAESNGDLILIVPVSSTPNVIVIGCPGALWTEPAGQKYPASLAAADVSGNLPAAVNEQANIDFGALQKQSLNAATPSVTVSDKTGFSLSVAPPTKVEIREEMDDHSTKLAAIAASGSDPVGSVTWTYTVTASGSHSPISGATVEVYSDLACTVLQKTAVTNGFGIATFRLVPGTYYVLAFAANYNNPTPDTEVVS